MSFKMEKQTIAVVIPCYRVEKTIEQVIRKVPERVDKIICVNDSSPDQTAEVIRSIKDPRVSLISHTRNQGVGGAMMTGYSYGLQQGVDIFVKVDGDDQMDLKYLDRLIEPILKEDADYVKGNRFLHSNELKRMPFFRKIGNLGLTFMTKVASGYWNIFDPTNGYTAISAAALNQLDPGRISRNYFFESSLLCELRRADAVARDVAIPAIYKDEKSSMNVPSQLFIFSFNLFRRFVSRIFYRYFMFDFTAGSFYIVMGILLGLFGGIWGIIKWAESARTGVAATTGTVLLAVLPVILAVQFLVQAVTLDIDDLPAGIQQRTPMEDQVQSAMFSHFSNLMEQNQVTLEKADGKH